jgi:TolB-like protein
MTLFAELKRRNVIRVAAAYVAVSWLLIQVAETLFPVFGLSDAAVRAVVIVLAIGFVPAVVIAWVFELTPDGLVRDAEVDRDSAVIRAATKRLDRIFMVALALAVGYFAFDKFMLDPARDAQLAEAAREEGRAEAAQQKRESGPPVIAVLPFAAITSTEDSEFFAAGVHDDLLTKLAQLPSMLVISRTSVQEYKGVQRNIREIGEALGADVILEGGVQSAGERIRINAQLIDAETDEHLWAETYDRELTAGNIFDVQDDIAHAIADALQSTFTAAARRPIPTSNMAAYRAYHEAVNVREASHGGTTSDEYRQLLSKAIELDPAFTRPLAELIGSYSLSVWFEKDPETMATIDKLMARMQAQAPDSVDALMAQTYYTYYVLSDYDLAHDIATQALERAPSDTRMLEIKSWIERRQGNFSAMIETRKLQRKLDPRNESLTSMIAFNLFLAHRYDEALAEFDSQETRDYFPNRYRAHINFREHGDFARLASELTALAEGQENPGITFDLMWAQLFARDYAAAAALVDKLPPGLADPRAHIKLSNRTIGQLITAHFMGRSEDVNALRKEAEAAIYELSSEEELASGNSLVGLAFLAALEGRTEDTVNAIRQWRQGIGTDWAGRILYRDIVCQLLGLAGAAEAAVECIREGLAEPSGIMPFFEPYVPLYDPVRDEPVFIELVEELAAGA